MLLRSRIAFTLIELLVVVAIIAVIASLLLPAITMVKSTANAAKCSSNLRQIYLGVIGYSDDYRGNVPVTHESMGHGNDTFWFALVAPYIDSNKKGTDGVGINGWRDLSQSTVIWGCPGYKKDPTKLWACGYGMNVWMRNPVVDGGGKRFTCFLGDNPAAQNWAGTFQNMNFASITHPSTRPMFGDSNTWAFGGGEARHRDRVGVAYVDGHVASVSAPLATKQVGDPGAN